MKLALAAAAALVAFAAGCGGAENEPENEPGSAGAGATSPFRMMMTESRSGGTFELRCDGAYDDARRRSRLACARPGEPSGYEFITIGDTTYFRPGDAESFAKSDDGNPAGSAGPATLFASLRAAAERTERLGPERIRGEPTTRYALTVECEQANVFAECRGPTAAVEVWIDGREIVRKIRMRQPGYVQTAEFFDFGVAVDIEPPPADRILKSATGAPPGDCPPAKPISVDVALDTLRRHGFDVARDEFNNCREPALAAVLVGTPVGGAAREALRCDVWSTSRANAPSSVVGATDRRSGTDVGRGLENLSCSLRVVGDAARVDDLQAAFEELQRTIHP